MRSKSWYRRVAVVVWLVPGGGTNSGGLTKRGDTADSKSPPLALITGSDRGIGFALVQELEMRGWRVVATCRDPEHADALKMFAAAHPRGAIEPLDVTDNAA